MDETSPETFAVQAARHIDEVTGALAPPVHPSTTFARDASYQLTGEYIYARNAAPNDRLVEQVIARLDGGADARLFASGMAAFCTLFETVPGGAHIVAPRQMYYAGQQWLRRISERRGIALDLCDMTDPDALRAAVRPASTRIVWAETPANPTWEVTDIAAAAEIAHGAGAILAVDSTAAPPVTTRPLELGADLVFHSATKYLNGHSDVTAGILVTGRRDELWREVDEVRTLLGATPGAFEAWLLLRGMRTLFLRFERASASALALARHFEPHPEVEAVLYPGLEGAPGHAVARRQMNAGFGGMLSLLVRGGARRARALAAATRLFVPATSLGGVESLIEHRRTIEGPDGTVAPNLLRLSVGIEPVGDLIADLEQALAASAATTEE